MKRIIQSSVLILGIVLEGGAQMQMQNKTTTNPTVQFNIDNPGTAAHPTISGTGAKLFLGCDNNLATNGFNVPRGFRAHLDEVVRQCVPQFFAAASSVDQALLGCIFNVQHSPGRNTRGL